MVMVHKRKVYVKAVYDEEFTPPQWGVIRFYKTKVGKQEAFEVFDWDGADNKKEAEKMAKEIAERRGEILVS